MALTRFAESSSLVALNTWHCRPAYLRVHSGQKPVDYIMCRSLCSDATAKRCAPIPLRRCIRSRGLLSAHKRVCISACVLANATFALHTTKITSKSAHTLRVLQESPCYVSNEALCARFGPVEPIAMLAGQSCATSNAGVLGLPPPALPSFLASEACRIVSLVADCTHHACVHCGLYFPSVKTLRQHEARKHGTLTEDFRVDLHARNGMPQCRHCDKTFFNMTYTAQCLPMAVLGGGSGR